MSKEKEMGKRCAVNKGHLVYVFSSISIVRESSETHNVQAYLSLLNQNGHLKIAPGDIYAC